MSAATPAKGAAPLSTIVELAHNLSMNVTAEGIETSEQLSQLTGLNCEQGQGYLLSRPLRSGAVTELLQATGACPAAA